MYKKFDSPLQALYQYQLTVRSKNVSAFKSSVSVYNSEVSFFSYKLISCAKFQKYLVTDNQ